jgi:Rap/ran-GAP/Tuberin/Domain of unknown function (DUF3384)
MKVRGGRVPDSEIISECTMVQSFHAPLQKIMTAVLKFLFTSLTAPLFFDGFFHDMPFNGLFGRLTSSRHHHAIPSQRRLWEEALRVERLSPVPSRLTGEGCMSENHAPLPQPVCESTGGHGPASTPASVSQLETPSTSRTSSRRGSQQPWISLTSHMSSQSIDFGQLKILSQDYDNSTQAAKQWLKSFGALKAGTNVSLKFVAIKVFNTAGTVARYPSLLPVLSSWLRLWFDKASAARFQKRKNQTDKAQKIFVPEDDDFEWICSYTTDYLALEHEGLAEEDIVVLTESALHICTKSGAAVDFDRLLRLLESVYSRYGCPGPVFEKSLYVLCGIRGSFRELPVRFNECLDLILLGPESLAAIQVLHGFLRTDITTLDGPRVSTTTNAARGVIQVFHQIVETKTAAALSTDDLLASLSSATTLQSGRVNEVVLPLCVTLVEQAPSLTKCSNEQFLKFMSVVNDAYLTVRIPSQASEHNLSSSLSTSKDTKLSEPGGPSSVRDYVDSVLEKYLRSLTGFKQSLVFKHFIDCAELQSAETSIQVLQFAGEKMLNWKTHEQWRDDALQIVRVFIQNPVITSDVRIAAIDVVESALWSPGLNWSSDDEGGLIGPEGATAIKLVQELFSVIKSELDAPILEALVDVTVRAVLTYDNWIFTEQICTDLEEVAFRGRSWAQTTKISEIGARGLVSIFMQSLNTDHVDRTDLAYRKLNQIASSFQVCAEARLAAMRLLFRIRCDSFGRIYVSQASDSEYLAAALCRTDDTIAKFPQAGDSWDDHGASRSSGFGSRRPKPTPPLWIYPGVPALPRTPELQPSEYVVVPGIEHPTWLRGRKRMELELSAWLESLIVCLQKDPDWETYSYIIVHLGAQLSNVTLLEGRARHIQFLRSVLCEQVRTTSFHEPPAATGLKKGDVALCVFNALTPLIAYKSHFGRNECDELVKAFVIGIGSFEGTSRGCIHSLSICCFEIPTSVTKNLSAIVHRIQTNATQSHLSMHFLEFLAGLARLPEVHTNLHGDEVRLIFGICVGYIKSMRDRQSQNSGHAVARTESAAARLSGATMPPFRAKIISAIELPQYVSALAYHTMIFWFLSLKLPERAKHVPWIIKSLTFVDNDGNEQIEEQGEVLIDMMQRTAFSDLGETVPHPDFAEESDGSITVASWLVGLSIVTIETAGRTGRSQLTKRQASGTTHSVYQQLTADLPTHHASLATDIQHETTIPAQLLPQHVLLQLTTSCAPTGLALQPLPLPDAEYVNRALRAFDLNATVDGNKIGVVYVGPGQTEEAEILANTQGSLDFDDFLEGLGTKVVLEGAKFNTQGLRGDTDGEYAYAWRDRVTEIVYHVPSMMPTNLEDDPRCTNKKRHIGNDHVNIIFNRSGHAFDFDTFNSQFNYVNIVVTPASRLVADEERGRRELQSVTEHASSGPVNSASSRNNKSPKFYNVHTLTAEGFPAISPASDPKIISSTNLPGFVRLIALNASVFSLAWRDRESPNDYVSSWRNRLQEIRRLRDRVTREAAAAVPEPRRGGALYAGYGKGGRTSLYPEGRGELTGERRAPVVDYEHAEVKGEEKMAELYDFSRWTVQ